MKHLVRGGVTMDPAPFARAEDDMRTAQIKEINTFRLPRNLFTPEAFKISTNLNRVIHSRS